tara:strand:+ start:395 stop:967 length:573 start_codon:yes stop_codon:yes gene_type:complete
MNALFLFAIMVVSLGVLWHHGYLDLFLGDAADDYGNDDADASSSNVGDNPVEDNPGDNLGDNNYDDDTSPTSTGSTSTGSIADTGSIGTMGSIADSTGGSTGNKGNIAAAREARLEKLNALGSCECVKRDPLINDRCVASATGYIEKLPFDSLCTDHKTQKSCEEQMFTLNPTKENLKEPNVEIQLCRWS